MRASGGGGEGRRLYLESSTHYSIACVQRREIKLFRASTKQLQKLGRALAQSFALTISGAPKLEKVCSDVSQQSQIQKGLSKFS